MVDSATLARGFMPAPEPVSEPEPAANNDDQVIVVDADGDETTNIEVRDGTVQVTHDDGSVEVDLDPKNPDSIDDDGDFNANLAGKLNEADQMSIVTTMLQAIDSDDQSRQEWLQTRAKGIDMLGFKLEDPRGDVGASSSPMEGMSTVRHPLLTEAVIRFQSNASGELLPPSGPCKVRNDSPPTPAAADAMTPPDPLSLDLDNDDLAEALEKDFNHYFTVIDKGYRADTDRMLFLVGFGGAGFKKCYHDPLRRIPISRSVDAADLIVSNDANDIDDAGRVTHRILMRHATLVRMQIAGAYRKVEGMSQPTYQPNALEQKIDSIQGFNTGILRPEDQLHTVYETYAELDLKGFEHQDEKGDFTGLPLPYKITIEKDSQKLLEIRRNWDEADPNCLAKKVFVKYPFVPAFGFYEIGLLQILGNTNRALTGAWREMLDSGMFANFPGFLYASGTGGRQLTNEFRVAPGSGVPINTGGKPITDIIMRLPYNDVTTGLSSLVERVEMVAQRLGGTADMLVGEGKQDAPVGTTLALIEQATKMLSAVHIRLHAAQSEEFQILKRLFSEDPESFWRHNKKAAFPWRRAEFLSALENVDVVPAADPNTPSHMHRIMKAVALKQLQSANPQLYDAKKIDTRIMRMIGISDPESMFAPPAPPGQDPAANDAMAKMAELNLKKQIAEEEMQDKQQGKMMDIQESNREAQQGAADRAVESQDRAADRASRERVATTREMTERIKALAGMAEKGLIGPEMAVAAIMASVGGQQQRPPVYNPPQAQMGMPQYLGRGGF